MTQRGKWVNPRARAYMAWKRELQVLAGAQGYTDMGSVLSMVFYMPMPKSWSEKKRQQMLGRPHQQRPDLDNLIKAVKDALCAEDSHVHTYKDMRKVWAHTAGIVITDYGKI
jgi:Holliday junction resolvase RusA-like endonuclease